MMPFLSFYFDPPIISRVLIDKHEFMDGLMHMNVTLNEHEFELLFSFMDSVSKMILSSK
jgi:hypothetical protein